MSITLGLKGIVAIVFGESSSSSQPDEDSSGKANGSLHMVVLLEILTTSYSSFSHFLGVSHGTWKEGENGSYTFTPPCPN